MFGLFKAKPNKHDEKILNRIRDARLSYSSMRVDENGSMVVDVKEIMADERYQEKTQKAHAIVSRA